MADLDVKDEALALSVARGETRAAAARAAGVSERTLRRRLAEPAFRARVSELRGEILDGVCGSLASIGGKAVETLATLMESAESDGVRLQAATSVLAMMLKAREAVEVDRRLAELEAVAQSVAKGRRP